MSISLNMHLADGGSEELPIGHQEAARAWGRIGKELGAKYLDGDYPIILRPTNILEVIKEFQMVLHASEAECGVGSEVRLRAAIERMERLSLEVGWKAMVS